VIVIREFVATKAVAKYNAIATYNVMATKREGYERVPMKLGKFVLSIPVHIDIESRKYWQLGLLANFR
jgi:hypothetical protein